MVWSSTARNIGSMIDGNTERNVGRRAGFQAFAFSFGAASFGPVSFGTGASGTGAGVAPSARPGRLVVVALRGPVEVHAGRDILFAATQCAIRTGNVAVARMCRVAPPNTIWRRRLWV